MAMRKISELSLRQRLLLLTMITSGAGVLLGSVCFLAYDTQAARDRKVGEMSSAADLIGMNSTTALAFDDPQGARRLLEALNTKRHIRAGVLYRLDGSFFAAHFRSDLSGKILPPVRPPEGMTWENDLLLCSSPVILDSQKVGSLYLESDLTDLRERWSRFAQWTALIALASLLVVYLLTAMLQRGITRPILDLAGIARSITAEKSYSLRAPPLSGRELRQLSGKDGYEFAHRLRHLESIEQPSIIILSSAPALDDPDQARAMGIERMLLKPIRRSILLEALREGLHLTSSTSARTAPLSATEVKKGPALRLLLAEDNGVNQKLATRLLEKMGHHVTVAVNGREAVDLFLREKFDLVLMDIQMPVLGGVEAVQEIRRAEHKTGEHIPIIALTAHAIAGTPRDTCPAAWMVTFPSPCDPAYFARKSTAWHERQKHNIGSQPKKEGKKCLVHLST